jgi:hypothetical protein
MIYRAPFSRCRRTTNAAFAVVLLAALFCKSASADVIVLANRTGGTLPVRFAPITGQAQQLVLPAGEVVPMFLDGRAHLTFAATGDSKSYLLDANCAYYFGRGPGGRIDLQQIGLGEDDSTRSGRSLPGSGSRAPTATISVKILVDEEEPGRQVIWERRLRRRIETASEILEKHCRIGLRVVAVGTWNSDNDTKDFVASLSEFEREVQPAPARLAIGFTSQWSMVTGRVHMAGTRGALHTHILAREGSPQISESEKLEFLVHELGHYLGAAHSPEPGSVMRPVLGDDRALRSNFAIRFDPVNTLIMAMVGEEIRRRDLTHISELTPDTRLRLKQIYEQLSRSLPNDLSSMRFLQLMSSAAATPLAASAKKVLQEIRRAAVANRALPVAISGDGGAPSRREGDALTDYYVRQAARAADTLPKDVAPRAFLVALGVGLDHSDLLAKVRGASGMARAVESPTERAARLAVLGEPTIRGRRDLAQHFFVSAFLAATMGSDIAQTAGTAKELVDAHGTSGFSFADLAADRAGAKFAEGIISRRFPLDLLSQGFSASAFVPDVAGLPEGLSAADVASQYGSANDPRFQKQLQAIDRRLLQLPPYRARATRLGP